MTQQPDLLEAAERIAAVLAEQGIAAIVIGAAALAAHRYVRHTEGIDLGVNIAVRDFAALAGKLRTGRKPKDRAVNGTSGWDPVP